MKSLLFSAIFFAVFVFGKSEIDKPCYDWDNDLKQIKDSCDKCRKDTSTQPEVAKCVYKLWELTDEEGNALASKIKDSYLIGLDESKREAVKEALKDCGKDKTEPLKEMKEVHAIWECTDNSLTKVCPEMKEKIEAMRKDPDLKGCLYE